MKFGGWSIRKGSGMGGGVAVGKKHEGYAHASRIMVALYI